MGKLTEAHIEQIRNMRADGKTYAEIQEFFQATYDIKIWTNEIAKALKGAPRKKRPYHRRGKKRHQAETGTGPEAEGQDQVMTLLRQAAALHQEDFLKKAKAALG
jgi:hypothetical protein